MRPAGSIARPGPGAGRRLPLGPKREAGSPWRSLVGPDYPRAVLAFHHLAIQCADLEACERFYREVLGLRVLRRWPLGEGRDRSVWLAVGESEAAGFLALERVGDAPEPRPWRDGRPGLHLVALQIAPGERARWEDRLAAAGVAVVHRTRWTIYFHDPEGNRVGLTHYPHDPEG